MITFNLNRISPSILFRFAWYLLIAGIVVFYSNQHIVTYPHINLSVLTPKPELIQVFCDNGSGFSQALSSSKSTSPAQQNGEAFSLPLTNSCKRLRLDLGSSGANVKVTSATIVTAGGVSVDIISSIKSPSFLNEIKLKKSNQLEFIATANDPYVVLSGEYSTITKPGYSLIIILKMIGIFVLVFCLVVASDYWANKEDTTPS